jgi:hypothetical protein
MVMSATAAVMDGSRLLRTDRAFVCKAEEEWASVTSYRCITVT